jgi:hypothetical protein
MFYDLHVHTSASDGILTPAEVLHQAEQIGLPGIAITDHDTVEGLSAAWACMESKHLNLELISGIELNTEVEAGEVHLLGYYIDDQCPQLLENLQEIKAARFMRARRMVSRLREMGYLITFEQVRNLAQNDLIARPHVAKALMEKGYVFSIREAFNKFIGRGCPAYVPRYRFTPRKAIELIQAAGGITVLAHPGLVRNTRLVEEILDMGVQGVEVFYPEHSIQETDYFLDMAARRGLLVTGGSDFHGGGSDNMRGRLGAAGLSPEYMAKIRAYRRENSLKKQ